MFGMSRVIELVRSMFRLGAYARLLVFIWLTMTISVGLVVAIARAANPMPSCLRTEVGSATIIDPKSSATFSIDSGKFEKPSQIPQTSNATGFSADGVRFAYFDKLQRDGLRVLTFTIPQPMIFRRPNHRFNAYL